MTDKLSEFMARVVTVSMTDRRLSLTQVGAHGIDLGRVIVMVMHPR